MTCGLLHPAAQPFPSIAREPPWRATTATTTKIDVLRIVR
jgi:hypothetical protein